MTADGTDAIHLLRRRIINVVGHELRTPLTTIRGLADLLADADEEELRETLIPALVRNAHRAQTLLDDLLVAGEVETATPVEAPAAVDLADVVASITADPEVAQVFSVEGAPDGPVLAHRDLVSRSLSRLIDNASAYAQGSPSVAFDADAGTVTVVVRTPVGAEIPDLELGFELFFRGEAAVTRTAGLGVGLPVARALARHDSGDVTIDQVDGIVETRLRLPRAP